MTRPGQRARAARGDLVGSVVEISHSPPDRRAVRLNRSGPWGCRPRWPDVLLGQLALEGVVDLDLVPVPHQDRDVRVLGDLVVGGPGGVLVDGQRDVLDAGVLGQLLQVFRGRLVALSVRTTTKLLSLSFSPIFSSICLTKLAKGSEVLRAKTQTTGAGPYRQR